MHKKNKKTIRP